MSFQAPSALLAQAHALSETLATRESDARWAVVSALHGRSEPLVFEACSRWAVGRHAFERALAADILGQLGCRDRAFPFRGASLALLAQLLADDAPEVQRNALIALSHRGVTEHADAVRRLASHEHADVRYGVALALIGDTHPESVRVMIELSRDQDADVREWATFGLGTQIDVDTPEVREALLSRCSDADPAIRAEGIAGLVRRGDPRAVDVLRRVLQRDDVGSLEVEAARDLASPELLGALESLPSWWDVDSALLEEAIARSRA